jgi:hypothetical protein
MWLDEDPTRTVGQLWEKYAGYAFIGAMLLYFVYDLFKRLNRAENEIAWLNRTLGGLGSKYRGWADHVTERLERLEGRPRR